MNETLPPLNQATEQQIAAALEAASIPTLMVSLIHMSGTADLLDGDIKPNQAMLSEVQGYMSEEDKAAVRQQALQVILKFKEGGCKLPAPPDDQTIQRMMAFITGEQEIDKNYLPMMLEEMSLDGIDRRQVAIDKTLLQKRAKAADRDFSVVIAGAGMSGLLAAIRMQQMGINYTVIEKNDDVGGTWYENSYPGCRVDIANHFYSYSFDHDHKWSKFFARRDELYGYFRSMAEKYGLLDNIRFNSEVTSARFDETRGLWVIDYRTGDKTTTLETDLFVSAVGQLNRPKIPELPGIDSFSGDQMHTARWQDGLDVKGKKIAVIGTGASAFQLVPELAAQDCELKVFQRSPPWMMSNPHYHESISPEKQWCLDNLPFYRDWFRFLLFWPGSDGAYPLLQIDPEWDDNGESINELNKIYRDILVDYIKGEVHQPELLEKVIPDYPPLGKRLLQDNGSWFKALQKDNVELICSAVAEVTPDGLITAEGEQYDFDILVWATGFYAANLLEPMNIQGRNGVVLHELWGEEPRAFLGITQPGFPNMFCLYGPSTNLAHAGSIIFHSECQVRYLMSAIKLMLERDIQVLECSEQAHTGYQQKLDKALSTIIWSYPKMNNWYKNSKGKVVNTSPWRLVDYWTWTQEVDPNDYDTEEIAICQLSS